MKNQSTVLYLEINSETVNLRNMSKHQEKRTNAMEMNSHRIPLQNGEKFRRLKRSVEARSEEEKQEERSDLNVQQIVGGLAQL